MTKNNLQKLHVLYAQSDLDALMFLKAVCEEEDKAEVELLIYLNETVGIGFGEPSSPEYEEEFNAREEEYFSRKLALLNKYDSEESWTGEAPVAANDEYYKVSDGWFDYYVNTTTGEKKYSLDEGDVCVERPVDDFYRGQ